MMRILYVADGRSPIALNWINGFVDLGYEVHLVSTFPCQPDIRLASFGVLPVAFSSFKKGDGRDGKKGKMKKGWWGAAAVQVRTGARQWFAPLTLPEASRRLSEMIGRIQPDLVHAMRIPYEGMVTALANPAMPLLVSVWGNDFTLHAHATPFLARYTRSTLQRSDALHADCFRDIRLAQAWGFSRTKPAVVLPGGGGVQLEVFHPPAGEDFSESIVRPGASLSPIVVNPRGFRAYVRNETFFQAIPLVLERQPAARFVCPAMAGEPQILRWIKHLGITENVDLLPQQSRPQMADLFRRAQTTVSLTTHDGTPNTLLEAMACGSFPIVGDLESLREWITPGINGLMVDPVDPQTLAEAVLTAFARPELRQRAGMYNLRLIAERAEYRKVMREAEAFYQRLVKK